MIVYVVAWGNEIPPEVDAWGNEIPAEVDTIWANSDDAEAQAAELNAEAKSASWHVQEWQVHEKRET